MSLKTNMQHLHAFIVSILHMSTECIRALEVINTRRQLSGVRR
jgi:hypothetical protein